MNKAIFFDRDGILNEDKDLISKVDDFNIFDEIPSLIESFREKGYKIFMVTNQTVVSRGILQEKELIELNNRFQSLLIKKNKNAIIDKILYCPHHPEADLIEYRVDCDCRKPKPGMILKLAKEYNINLSKSYVIGDRVSDIISGYLAGCKTIKFLSGKHNKRPIVSCLENYEELINLTPNYVITSLCELKEIIL